jgi:hypothetical protein
MNVKCFALAGLLAAGCWMGSGKMAAAADKNPEAATPLEQMDRLVGGEWHLDGVEKLKAYNTYTWGPTHRVLHFRSYFITPEGNKLRAEGSYMWDPVKKKIVGRTAGVTGDIYDGESVFEGNKLTTELTHSTPTDTGRYVETFEFTDKDTYRWTLYSRTGTEQKLVIQADFHRK